jgi:signal transduction histidine kinase
LLATLVVGITLVGGAIGLLATLEHSLVSNRDALSRARAVDLAEQAEQGDLPRRLRDIGEDFVGQVVTADGTVLAASSGLIGRGPISSLNGDTSAPVVRTLHGVPDDSELEDYRVWMLRRDTPSGPVTVFVGASLESVHEAVSTLRRALVIGVPVLLGLFVLGTRVLVGRALKPVEDIRAEVATISASALDRRVATPVTSDEIGRLTQTMNDMLDRLQAASVRQQQFVADASHELQSPLAALRVQLEVALAHPDDVAWETIARELLDDSDRMERLVRDLLFLAQEDSGQSVP